jgi:hypothetical protein
MPIPKPNPGEQKDSFIQRCMGSEVMNKEYPDQKQRYAVCIRETKTSAETLDDSYYFNSYGFTEELSEENLLIPNDEDYIDFESECGSDEEEDYCIAANKPGLWENIRKKKERMGKKYKPSKPGDKDRPKPDAFKKSQSIASMMEYVFTSKEEAMKAAKKMGLDGVFSHTSEGKTVWIPGKDIEELEDWLEAEEELSEAAEKKSNVKLNKPFRTPGGPKKFSVYVKNDKGNVVKVNFGDPNMSIKRDDPERRKIFRARHNCQNAGPRWKAKYWSCKFWSAKKVSDMA